MRTSSRSGRPPPRTPTGTGRSSATTRRQSFDQPPRVPCARRWRYAPRQSAFVGGDPALLIPSIGGFWPSGARHSDLLQHVRRQRPPYQLFERGERRRLRDPTTLAPAARERRRALRRQRVPRATPIVGVGLADVTRASARLRCLASLSGQNCAARAASTTRLQRRSRTRRTSATTTAMDSLHRRRRRVGPSHFLVTDAPPTR